jgi:small conductance mechanosensitive channel
MDIIWNQLPDIVSALVFLIVAWLIIGRVIKFLDYTMTHRTLDATLSSFVKSFVSVALKTIVLITAAGIAGFEVTSLVTLMGAAGLAIGLSLQGELQNFAGGVMLLFFKPFEVDDFITVGQFSGKVEQILMFNTKLRTVESHQVILPNKMLSHEVITNYTKSDEVAVTIMFDCSLKNYNWENVRHDCSAVVLQMFNEQLIIQDHFELRIVKEDNERVYHHLVIRASRGNVDEAKHHFWLNYLNNRNV